MKPKTFATSGLLLSVIFSAGAWAVEASEAQIKELCARNKKDEIILAFDGKRGPLRILFCETKNISEIRRDEACAFIHREIKYHEADAQKSETLELEQHNIWQAGEYRKAADQFCTPSTSSLVPRTLMAFGRQP